MWLYEEEPSLLGREILQVRLSPHAASRLLLKHFRLLLKCALRDSAHGIENLGVGVSWNGINYFSRQFSLDLYLFQVFILL